MKITIPKPKIVCPECNIETKIELKELNECYIEDGLTFECIHCWFYDSIYFYFEEDQTFCNCELCKKLMVDKGCEIN